LETVLFDQICRATPAWRLVYNIRRPVFHYPKIKHKFAEQILSYQLVKLLNVRGSEIYKMKVQSLHFYGFKSYVKYDIIRSYADRCYNANCASCPRIARRKIVG